MTEPNSDLVALAQHVIAGAPTGNLEAAAAIGEAALRAWRADALGRLAALQAAPGSSDPPPLRLHHVGIVARDDEQIRRFAAHLRLREVKREYLSKYRVTNVFFSPGGGAQIQFMLPEAGMLKNFNGGRGGLHHIAFLTHDVTPVQRAMETQGVRFIAREKQQGIGNFYFNFVLPNLEGVAVELIEDPDANL